MTSIFEGQPPKTRPFLTKTRGPIWVPGIIYIYNILVTKNPSGSIDPMGVSGCHGLPARRLEAWLFGHEKTCYFSRQIDSDGVEW